MFFLIIDRCDFIFYNEVDNLFCIAEWQVI